VKHALLALPLTVALIALTAALAMRSDSDRSFDLGGFPLLGEYGRTGPPRTPVARPAAGPYPFDSWLSLPPGTMELNRIRAREGRQDLFFAEFLIPTETPLDFPALKAQLGGLGYRIGPAQGALDGFDYELVQAGAILEYGAVFLVERASAQDKVDKVDKVWITVTRFGEGP
jgi:hypothetical protein